MDPRRATGRSIAVDWLRAIALIALVGFRPGAAFATDWAGPGCPAGGFTVAGSPWNLTGPVTIAAGSSCTVAPGVTISGPYPYGGDLRVQAGGTLMAEGTSILLRDVRFENIYLSFEPGSAGELRHGTLTGPYYDYRPTVGITEATVTVEECTLEQTLWAIGVGGSSGLPPAVVVRGNQISTIFGYGIDVSGTAQAAIDGNTITGAVDGITVHDTAQPTVMGNTLTAEQGIRVYDLAQPTVTGNTLTVSGRGLWYAGAAGGTASGNVIGFSSDGSGRQGILVEGDAAPSIVGNILFEDPAQTDTGIWLEVNPGNPVQVTNNTICVSGSDTEIYLAPGFTPAPGQISGNSTTCVNTPTPTATGTNTATGTVTITRTVTNTATVTPTGPTPTEPPATVTPTWPSVPPGEALVRIGTASGRPGDTVTFGVTLFGSETVAGTQNDIIFDPDTPVLSNASGRPDCTVNPAIGKDETSFSFEPAGCLAGACTGVRVLVLDLSNVDPIPAGALLYTCRASIAPTTVENHYLACRNAGASDPDGGALEAVCEDGAILVEGAPPLSTRTPTDTPTATGTKRRLGR